MTNRFYDVLIFHPTGGWGGAERTTLNIATALSRASINVVVLTNEVAFEKAISDRLPVIVNPFISWFGNWGEILRDLFRFCFYIRRIKPRIVLAMMPYAAFIASVTRKLMPGSFIHVASPRGSCLNYLKHFAPPSHRGLYKIFF